MKTAIIYYSLNGNTEAAAQKMAQEIGADLFRIETVKPYPKFIVFQILVAGFAATFKRLCPIMPSIFVPANYDLIFIGSPTWAGSITPAIRTALFKFDFSSRKVALFTSCAGNTSEAINQMKEILSNSTIVGDQLATDPGKKPTELAKLVSWAKELTK